MLPFSIEAPDTPKIEFRREVLKCVRPSMFIMNDCPIVTFIRIGIQDIFVGNDCCVNVRFRKKLLKRVCLQEGTIIFIYNPCDNCQFHRNALQ